jgi:hypothetical protein
LAVDLDGVRSGEAGLPVDQLDPVDIDQILVLVVSHGRHQFVLLSHQGREIDDACGGWHPGEGGVTGTVVLLGGSEQHLGGDTADIDTCPADGAVYQLLHTLFGSD